MTVTLVPGLKHRPAQMCQVSCFHDLCATGGYPVGEEVVFGLGTGLAFGYASMVNASPTEPLRFEVSILNTWFRECFFANTGIPFRLHDLRDGEAAWQRLLLLLSRGIPVPTQLYPTHSAGLMARVDPRLVPYVRNHWALVVGHDTERNEVLLYESQGFDPVRMPEARFREGRALGRGAAATMNQWLEVAWPVEPSVPLHTGLRLALRQAVRGMKYLDTFETKGRTGMHLGLGGLRRFARQLPLWPRLLPAEHVHGNALRLLNALTNGGGTKDALRGLYSRFLATAARELGAPALTGASESYRRAAREWAQLIKLLQAAVETENPLPHLQVGSALETQLRVVVEAEAGALDQLEAAVRGLGGRPHE